jgi:hypothetical protein
MAKVQGKKTASGAHKHAGKKAVRRPSHAKSAARKPARKAPTAPRKKASKPPKPAARPRPVAKTAAAPARPVAHPRPAAAKAAPKHPVPPQAKPPTAEKKRSRRGRTRVQSSGPIVAAWFSSGDKRPSSFIPAPPRAEGPSLIAAPPASSDRLVSTHELTEFVVRTVPVRIDVEAAAGRVHLAISPDQVILKPGEGIEWDFRYVGGADVIVDELIIEFEKPSPFSQSNFRSRRPGTARPHRQLSGAAHKNAAGRTAQYTIRALNGFKTEMAVARPSVTIVP